MVDPFHPLVLKIREIAMAYPEAAEVESWGRPSFRAGKKVFLLVGTMNAPFSILFTPDEDDRQALTQDARFFVPKYWGASGWLGLDVSPDDTDWTEVAELIDASYRQVALVRQLKQLDARDADG